MANRKYSASHEWVELDGDVATIGITDYAQSSLGTIVFVDLPNPGKSFAENDVFGVVESVKAASDLYLPLSGTITEINETLVSSPDLINSDAETTWIIKLKVSNLAEFDNLMTEDAYLALPK
jgi:glycine cleavage system H protein